MRAFVIRLLQVIWVLSAVIAVIAIIAHAFNGDLYGVTGTIFGFFVWSILLIVIQYLTFAKLDPRYLFDGSLNKKR